jgi:hypothetical protein
MWINVKERLPELLQKVLFYCIQEGHLKNIYMGYRCKEGWDIYLPYDAYKMNSHYFIVTHWMELPDFPK